MIRQISISLISLVLLSSCSKKDDLPNAPQAAKIALETKLEWGDVQSDNYAWLRDKDWPKSVKDSKILDHLTAENKYTEAFFNDEKENQEKLFTELKSRIKLTDQTVSIKRDDYFYYSRVEEDKSYNIYCRKHGSMDAAEEIILDVNKIAEGKNFSDVNVVVNSPNHKLLAYSVDFSGDERYMIKLIDLEKKEYLPDLIPDTQGDIVWHENLNGFFYVTTNKEMRHDTVMFHEIGTDVSQDKTIFHESNKLNYISISMTNSRGFVVIESNTPSDSEAYIVSLQDIDLKPILVQARKPNIKFTVNHNGDYIYILTNDNGPNMRLLRSNIRDLGNDSWREYIPQDTQKYLQSFELTANYLILNYKSDGLAFIKILHLNDSTAKVVTFPDTAFVAKGFSTNFTENDLRISYSSLTKPQTIYSYDFDNSKLITLKEQEVLGGFKSEDYKVERVWAQNDGQSIPISLYYKKSLFKKDGSNPLFVYSYGAYGVATPPQFYITTLSLIDRGFVFAIPHVRGGDDLGYKWYEQAKLLNKKKTFEDLISCIEFLNHEKYSKPQNIVIFGGSSGGMLMLAAANMRPDLFKAVVTRYPYADILNSLLDETLPLTPAGYKEFGNPHDKEYYNYIKSYSPYDNIVKRDYPSVFILNALYDTRIGYWEAAKYVAKLREYKTNGTVTLLKTNMEAGHFGASDRFEYLKEYVDQYMFIFKTFGIKPFEEEKK